jgi:ligand-binding sensor domain-containing protein
MNKNRFLLLLMFLSSVCSVKSQVVWKSYSSGNIIKDMVRKDDELWVGTLGNGLIKINTKTGATKMFQKINSGIKSDRIWNLSMDKNGDLLAVVDVVDTLSGTQLWRFDKINKWEHIWTGGSYADVKVDSLNNILVASDRDVYKITGTDATRITGLPNEQYWCIGVDATGVQWFGSDYHLIKYDNGVIASYDKNDCDGLSYGVRSIAFDGNILWLGTGKGLIRFDGTTWKHWVNEGSKASAGNISQVAVDKSHTVWTANYDFIAKFDGTNFTNYSDTVNIFKYNWATDICIDDNGSKWVGTSDQGLYKFDTSFVKQNTSSSPLPTAGSVCMAEDIHGKKWFATNSTFYGITSFDGTNWISYTKENSGYTANHCWDLACDPAGNTWCISWDGLFKFDGNTWTKYSLSNTYSQLEFHDGKVWLGGYNEVMTFDGSNWNSFPVPNAKFITGIAFDKNGKGWFASAENGLYCYNGSSFINYNTANSGIASDMSNGICVDGHNNIWVSSITSLSKFDGTTWTNDTTIDFKLPGNYIYGLSADAKNNIWISSYLKLIRFNGTSWKIYDQKNSPVVWPTNVSFDKAGNKWITLSGGGFLFLDDDRPVIVNENVPLHSNISIYPNPVGDNAFVNFEGVSSEKYTFTLITLQGKTVLELDNITTSAVKIDLGKLPKGLYLYKVTGNQDVIGTGKLIIQ